MLRKGSLHARDPEPLADGSYLAVTLANQPPHGIMAWAGTLGARVAGKAPPDISLSDYDHAEKVSFCRWVDVWDYFAGRQYDGILTRLRAEVERLYPDE